MFANLFYGYGFIELFLVILFLFKKNNNEIVDSFHPINYFYNFNLVKIISYSAYILWCFIGFFSRFYAIFAVLFSLKIIIPLMIDYLHPNDAKIIYFINKLIKISLIILILYFYFSN